MKKNIDIVVANPAGNKTIFVLDKFSRSQYQTIASQLLDMKDLEGEQVAFITGTDSMEMCGLEFCGNASRAFALMLGHNRSIKGATSITVRVSGCDQPLSVHVNTNNNYTKVNMPLPLSISTMANGGSIVDLGGIIHVIIQDVPATPENFHKIKEHIMEKFSPPAMGVMFYDTEKQFMTPVVYVKDVDSTYFEGSCGSGTTAIAAAFSKDKLDGTYHYIFPQPAGTINSTVEKVDGKIKTISIEGTITFSQIIHKEINL